MNKWKMSVNVTEAIVSQRSPIKSPYSEMRKFDCLFADRALAHTYLRETSKLLYRRIFFFKITPR